MKISVGYVILTWMSLTQLQGKCILLITNMDPTVIEATTLPTILTSMQASTATIACTFFSVAIISCFVAHHEQRKFRHRCHLLSRIR